MQNEEKLFHVESYPANWDSKKNNLKSRFPILTDADLSCSSSDTGAGLFENLQQKLGLDSDELSIMIMSC